MARLTDDEIYKIVTKASTCKDQQTIMRAFYKKDDSWFRALLLQKYKTFANIFNKLCHYEESVDKRRPKTLPSLDYMFPYTYLSGCTARMPKFPPRANVLVTFMFSHPINDGRWFNGSTFAAYSQGENPYESFEHAFHATWLCEVAVWNAYQARVKQMTDTELRQSARVWGQKLKIWARSGRLDPNTPPHTPQP